MIAGALIVGLSLRIFMLVYRLDYFINLGSDWISLSGISAAFFSIGVFVSILIFKHGIRWNFFIALLWSHIFPLILLLELEDRTSLFITSCVFCLIAGMDMLPAALFGSIAKIEYRGRKTGVFCLIGFSFGALLFLISLFMPFLPFILIIIILVSGLAIFFMKLQSKKNEIFNLDDTIEKTNSYKKLFYYLVPITFVILIVSHFGFLTFINYPSHIGSFYITATPPEYLDRIVD
jgi:hypothetical protein